MWTLPKLAACSVAKSPYLKHSLRTFATTQRSKVKMGQLINGKWTETNEVQPNPTVHAYELGTSEFPFDEHTPAGRYHLYVAKSCPFAQRAEIALNVKKLSSKIGLSHVNPVQTPQGWGFEPHDIPGVGDQVHHLKYLHEVYSKFDPNYTGRASVPLLVDTETNRIVSKESADIVAIFSKISNEGPDLRLHPEAQEKAAPFFGQFFGGVLKVGKSQYQKSYDEAIASLYETIESIDAFLADKKFLAGDELTAVDIDTFPAFAYFEIGLALKMSITGNRLRDYPNLDAYIRRVYQVPDVGRSVNAAHWKMSMFAEINKGNFISEKKEHIVPATPTLDWNKPIN